MPRSFGTVTWWKKEQKRREKKKKKHDSRKRGGMNIRAVEGDFKREKIVIDKCNAVR